MSEYEDENFNRFQNSPPKEENSNNFEEDFEPDYDEAYENTDSLRASSVTMNYSVSKTGNFDEHIELPPARYGKVIEEHPEENEDSKYQQPTKEELEMQQQRIRKAQEALSKLKKDEASKKKQKPVPDNSRKAQKSKSSVAIKPKIESKKKPPEKPAKKPSEGLFVKEEPKDSGTFSAFQLERPAKATNEMPTIAKSDNPRPPIPTLKLKSTTSTDLKLKKQEEEAKAAQDHKENLEKMRSIFDSKKAKADQDLKRMQEMQKNLLEKEKNYKPPNQERIKVRTIPPPPPAPKPRALNQDCYKLHQLAESTGAKDARLTADKVSGSMLQAIKVLSTKISEEFPFSEILQEEKRAEQAEKLLATGRDMKRGEIDYNEESKKKILMYKSLIADYKGLVDKKAGMLKAQEELLERLKKLEAIKAVVKLGDGKYVRAGMMPDDLIDTLEELDSVGSEVMKENPIDLVIEKIEKQGSSLKSLFNEIDVDGDKILTIVEIRNGLSSVQIRLSEEDKALLLKTLDSNSDGVVSEEEFFKILDPKLKIQQEYRALVGNVDINNPIIFEELILDMKLRGRMLHQEIPKIANKLKSKLEVENKLMRRIKHLEEILEQRQVKSFSSPETKKELEDQLKAANDKKSEVFQIAMQERSNNAMRVSGLQEKMIGANREKAQLTAELEHQKFTLANTKLRNEAIKSKEERLDKENKFIAIVIIQARIRRYLARIRYAKEKKKVEGALNVIVPVMRDFTKKQKEKRVLNGPEVPVEKEPLSEERSVKSQYSEPPEYFCENCQKRADRICLSCKANRCANCFNECRIEEHGFGLVSSASFRLNAAEKEFLMSVKDIEQNSNKSLLEIFTAEKPIKGKLSYNVVKRALFDVKPSIDRVSIQNIMILAEKFVGEDNSVEIQRFCELFQ